MKMSTVVEVVQRFMYAFPNAKTPGDQAGQRAMMEVWYSALRDLQDADVITAAQRWIMHEEWFPTPSQIRKEAIRAEMALPTPVAACSEAFRVGASSDPTVWASAHPVVIQALRDIGGARAVNEATDILRLQDAYMKAYDRRVNDLYEQKATEAMLDGDSNVKKLEG